MAAARDDAGRGADAWWRDALVYQIYVRSFQDSDGDGIGDLRGVIRRLDHVKSLGADAIWLSPIHPSPNADLGYDVADYMGIDPALGTAADFDELVAAAHARGLRVLLDLVASHTSIEHPWFRDHPERYIWAEAGPPNNWRAAFGGPAWSSRPGSGRWYLHSFFAEQADLDWRNPDVRREMGEVVAHWLERGVDGFRVDAAQQLVKDERLRDDPPASAAFPLPLHEERVALRQLHSGNDPETTLALSSLRESAGDAFLVGEVYLPTDALPAYLRYLDSAFAFEFFHAPWDAARLREVIAAAAGPRRPRLGALEPRLPPRRDPPRPRERRRRGAAAADPARPRVRLPGRGDRDGGRPRRRSARRPRGPRRRAPSDAMGGGPARRLHRPRARSRGSRRPTPSAATSPTRRPTPARCSTSIAA